MTLTDGQFVEQAGLIANLMKEQNKLNAGLAEGTRVNFFSYAKQVSIWNVGELSKLTAKFSNDEKQKLDEIIVEVFPKGEMKFYTEEVFDVIALFLNICLRIRELQTAEV